MLGKLARPAKMAEPRTIERLFLKIREFPHAHACASALTHECAHIGNQTHACKHAPLSRMLTHLHTLLLNVYKSKARSGGACL